MRLLRRSYHSALIKARGRQQNRSVGGVSHTMNLYRELSIKAVVLEEHWRQIKRWAWRHLNFAHPGERADRGQPAQLTSAMTAQGEAAVTRMPARTLAENCRDEMNAQSATLDAARTAWEEHSKTRVMPTIDSSARGALLRTTRSSVQRHHSIIPIIIVADADKTIDFLKQAFGLQENYRLTTLQGKVADCELQLERSIVHLSESMEGRLAHGLVAKIQVKDADTLFDRALIAGAVSVSPMADMYSGAREGRLVDPFGNVWIIATQSEDISPQEMQRWITAKDAASRSSNLRTVIERTEPGGSRPSDRS